MNIEILTPDECAAVRQVIDPAPCDQVQYIGEILLENMSRKERGERKEIN